MKLKHDKRRTWKSIEKLFSELFADTCTAGIRLLPLTLAHFSSSLSPSNAFFL